jgi:hypothetical protein
VVTRTVALSVAGTALTLSLVACGGNQSAPTAVQSPAVTAATPTPSPTPKAAPSLPAGMVCSEPTPPPILRMNVKIHGYEGSRIVFDSKPVVANINGYCDKVGFGDWKFCDTRPEGTSERVACDYLVAGYSVESQRWGPTWYFNDQLCGTDPTQCAPHPTEQFMTIGKAKGTYEVCAAETTPVAPGGTRCGTYVLE